MYYKADTRCTVTYEKENDSLHRQRLKSQRILPRNTIDIYIRTICYKGIWENITTGYDKTWKLTRITSNYPGFVFDNGVLFSAHARGCDWTIFVNDSVLDMVRSHLIIRHHLIARQPDCQTPASSLFWWYVGMRENIFGEKPDVFYWLSCHVITTNVIKNLIQLPKTSTIQIRLPAVIILFKSLLDILRLKNLFDAATRHLWHLHKGKFKRLRDAKIFLRQMGGEHSFIIRLQHKTR